MRIMTAKVNPLVHLVNTLQSEGDILVFLGAGSSTEGSQDDSSFPDFETLVARVLRDEGIEVTDSRMNDFLDVMRRWERESALSVRLASYLYGNPGISHLQLASVTMSVFPAVNMAVYLTTNFDDLMFKALSAVAKNAPQRDPRSFSLKKPTVVSEITQLFQAIPRHSHKGVPVIVKLFGDLASTSPIFDSNEMPFDELTEEKLLRLLDRPILFIGYGLHDAPILRLLIRSASQSPVFVVSPKNPIDDRVATMSQRTFYWLPMTFSAFVSDLIETFSAKNPSFDNTFSGFLRAAGADFALDSRWAIRDCVQSASSPARQRYLNRTRRSEPNDSGLLPTITRPDTGPDFDAFKTSKGRILAVVGESGSGKSTLLATIYETHSPIGDDLYIYYDAQSFQSPGSISAKLTLDLAADTATLGTVLRRIGSTLDRKGSARLFVMIDALNESASVDPLTVRYEIETLVAQSPNNIRFIFSCRRVFWDARMNPSNDLPSDLYFDGKVFLLSKFSADEAKSAFERYRQTFRLRSMYDTLSGPLREHIRDPLMLRFISQAYRDSLLPQFAPAVLVFREVMDALRRQYRQTPLIDFIDCLIDQRLEHLLLGDDANDIFYYRTVRTDSNLALLAQQQMGGRRYAEHPLTILEDENVITPMESVYTRFKFTYERFYEYLIGLRLHYKIFLAENHAFADFAKVNLTRFRDAHYSFYQGLKSSFVMEFIASRDVERRREIVLLVRHPNRSVAAFGKDVLREVIFESGEDAISTLALAGDSEHSVAALVLDLGFEAEGVLPYAIEGLFHKDGVVRRRSVSCLIFHAASFASLDTMNAMILTAVGRDSLAKDELATGLVYFFSAAFAAAADKGTGLRVLHGLLGDILVRWPDRVKLSDIAAAAVAAVRLEGPLFFGANYGAEGIFHPWQETREDVVRHHAAVRAILDNATAETLRQHLAAILFLSDIRVEQRLDGAGVRLFAYQIEYRIVQWAFIRSWTRDNEAVLALLDEIVKQGRGFNIDFAISVLEHIIFRIPNDDRELLAQCRVVMANWIGAFEERFTEFYLCLDEADPFSFNLIPLAVLARVEANFFTPDSGVIPCVANWLADSSANRRKIALLASNWIAREFPTKVLTTLEATVLTGGLTEWYDRVLAGFERHSPRLLDEFFNKMHFPIRRRTSIRAFDEIHTAWDVQYQCEEFFSWLFLEDENLKRLGTIYDAIYAAPSAEGFFLTLLKFWLDRGRVAVK